MMKGEIFSISISEAKHTLKQAVRVAKVYEQGLKGDGHAGDWDRQVTLMDYKDFEDVREQHHPDLKPGDMAENIIVRGLDFSMITPGTKIALGENAVVQVSQIGKEDHPSVVTRTFGVSVLPYRGLFCRVIQTGNIQVGDSVTLLP